jgi:hypothetical protein
LSCEHESSTKKSSWRVDATRLPAMVQGAAKVPFRDSWFPFQESQHCGFVNCLFTSRLVLLIVKT